MIEITIQHPGSPFGDSYTAVDLAIWHPIPEQPEVMMIAFLDPTHNQELSPFGGELPRGANITMAAPSVLVFGCKEHYKRHAVKLLDKIFEPGKPGISWDDWERIATRQREQDRRADVVDAAKRDGLLWLARTARDYEENRAHQITSITPGQRGKD